MRGARARPHPRGAAAARRASGRAGPPWAFALGLLLLLAPAPVRAQEDRVPPADTLEDAGAHHLFLAPTGRTHPQGTRTAGVFAYIFPYVGYAATDWLHLGGGVPLWVLSGDGPVVYLTPKVRLFQGGGVEGAVGSLSFIAFGHGGLRADPGVLYGVLTADLGPLSVTGGVARGFDDFHSGVFPLGGIEAVLARTPAGRPAMKLLGEVFGFPRRGSYFLDGDATGAFTVRFLGERAAFDVAVPWTRDAGDLEMAFFPLVGLTFIF